MKWNFFRPLNSRQAGTRLIHVRYGIYCAKYYWPGFRVYTLTNVTSANVNVCMCTYFECVLCTLKATASRFSPEVTFNKVTFPGGNLCDRVGRTDWHFSPYFLLFVHICTVNLSPHSVDVFICPLRSATRQVVESIEYPVQDDDAFSGECPLNEVGGKVIRVRINLPHRHPFVALRIYIRRRRLCLSEREDMHFDGRREGWYQGHHGRDRCTD